MSRVLILEDEKDTRDILKQMLEKEKVTILTAENGQIGLDLMKDQEVDLILLDLFMPVMDGTTFYKELRNTLKKNTPVIILTNLDGATPPDADIKDYIVKANTSLPEVITRIMAQLPKS